MGVVRPRAGAPSASPGLSPTQRYWIGGLLLLLAALLAFTGLFSVHPGSLVGWWLGLLQRLFGWGAAVAAVILTVLGIWLVARGAERPLSLPWRRLAGGLIIFLAGLAFSHHFALVNDRSTDLLVGGELGRWIDQPLRGALGGAGAVVMLAVALLGGLMLTMNLSVAELAADLADVSDRTGERFHGWRLARAARRRARSASRTEQIELPLNEAPMARGTPAGVVARGPAVAATTAPQGVATASVTPTALAVGRRPYAGGAAPFRSAA